MSKNQQAIELPVPQSAKDREVISAQAGRIATLNRKLRDAIAGNDRMCKENTALKREMRENEKRHVAALDRMQADIDEIEQRIRG